MIRLYDLADLLQANKELTAVPGRSDDPTALTVRPVEPIEPFKLLFQDTIAVETWRDNGGSVGAVHCVGTRLVIVQSHDAHRQIRRMLQSLRTQPPPPPGGPAPELVDWHEGLGRWVPHDADVEEMAVSARVNRLRLDQVPFEQAIDALGRSAGVKLVLRREVLQGQGTPLAAPVTLELHDVTLADALDKLLRAVPAGPRLGYTPEAGVVTVSTKAETDKVTYSRVYNMRDWYPRHGPDADRAYDALRTAVMESVDPESWKDNGGASGHLREFGGLLAVIQTWENHQKVRSLLTALRAGRGLPTTQPAGSAATRPTRVFVPPEVER